ncbi:MAG: preprotein translocase subunit SecA, partial [Phycisphaerales bacterium]|nr:preprotein translocase subunit SecA [Phycisphaerales bacterium]
RDGRVIIVDEFTGRLMEGRQWSDGLHQSVEAKEGVKIKEETQTLATITLQNYFKLYKKLAGMTGTALTEAEEFMKIYQLDVVAVPTNLPCQRDDRVDRIYASEEAKYRAIVEEIHSQSEAGRPVLVGTTSIEKSEYLSNLLKHEYGIQHEVLNGRAENAAREAEIVDKAGHQRPLKAGSNTMVGNVTIATNMAGRGTDIKLSPEVLEAGGLHIVGTERHESRRIDNQLRGRAGRQGDAGSSQFFLSLRDDLMSIFASEMMLKMLARLGFTGDQHIESRMLSRGVEKAQRKVEERNFEIRKSLLDYDEVMDFQRKAFYEMRQRVLEGRELRTLLDEMNEVTLEESVWDYLDGNYERRCVAEFARQQLQCPIPEERVKLRGNDLPALEYELREYAKADALQTINITLGEYMEEDIDPRDWDYRGLSQWAMSRFSVQLSQNQLRKMDSADIETTLSEAALERIDAIDLSGLAPMLEETYAHDALCDWARAKFDIDVTVEELGKTPDEALLALSEKVSDAYRKRVIEYPCEHAVEQTVASSGVENVYALESLATWANRKYDANWTGESLAGKSMKEIFNDLVGLSAKWNAEGYIQESLRKALGETPTMEAVCEHLNERYNIDLTIEEGSEVQPLEVGENVIAEFLRREMTELERYVLLQLCDTTWKDHLLNMDNLKGSIHLRGYAEQDPKVAFKREGSRMFDEMLTGIRERVTDMIFKVSLTSSAEMESVYQISNQVHEQLSGYDHLTQDMAAQQEAGAQEAVKPIINTGEKVGRNDPCPCGSGRKYKKCCGQHE